MERVRGRDGTLLSVVRASEEGSGEIFLLCLALFGIDCSSMKKVEQLSPTNKSTTREVIWTHRHNKILYYFTPLHSRCWAAGLLRYH